MSRLIASRNPSTPPNHRGVSEAAVSKAIRQKRISLIDGKIDPAVADVQWSANTRVRASATGKAAKNVVAHVGPQSNAERAPATDPDPADVAAPAGYSTSRARREAAEADLAEIRLATERGEIVEKRAVDKAAFEAARAMRDGLMNCSRRLGATVAVLSTPDECAAAISSEHRNLLQKLGPRHGHDLRDSRPLSSTASTTTRGPPDHAALVRHRIRATAGRCRRLAIRRLDAPIDPGRHRALGSGTADALLEAPSEFRQCSRSSTSPGA